MAVRPRRHAFVDQPLSSTAFGREQRVAAGAAGTPGERRRGSQGVLITGQ